jgi:hypothetical protein
MGVGGSSGPVLLQYTNSGLKISPDGKSIQASINPKTADGVDGKKGAKQRNELSVQQRLKDGKGTISFDMQLGGAVKNTDGEIINTFQLKPPNSNYASVTLGVKDGKYAVKVGGKNSVTTNFDANTPIHVNVKVNNGKGELYINGVKQTTSAFNVPTSANIKFGLEASGNATGTVESKYDDIAIS